MKRLNITVTPEIEKMITEMYLEVWSISEIRRRLPEDQRVSREKIVKILTDANVYEGLTGENYTKHSQTRIQQKVKDKFGVKNYGMVSGGWSISNKIPYTKVNCFDKEFTEYKEQVDKLTRKNLKKIVKPEYCEYTGVKFIDAIQDRVNPNDPRKRTVDHRIPVITCFLNNVTVEEASALHNLAFVLRYVNTIKSNSTYESFIPLAKKIRKIMINENFPHN